MSLWVFVERMLVAAPKAWQSVVGLAWLANRAAIQVYPDRSEMLGTETVWKVGDRDRYAAQVEFCRSSTSLAVSPTTFLSDDHLVVRDEYWNGFLSGFKPTLYNGRKSLIGSPVDYWRRGHWRRGDIGKLDRAVERGVHAHIERVVVLDEGGCHFGHWVFEMLPTIQYTLDLDCVYVVLSWDDWKVEYLKNLGIPESSILKWNGRESYSFDRLYLLRGRNLLVRSRLEWLRSRLLTGNEALSNDSEKIYVSRQGRNRSVSNFEELLPVLVRLGFQVVDPGLLSTQEAIAVFQNAKFVVGPEGSGMRNVLWSREACVMEIHSGLVTLGQWQFAAQLGHSYVPYLVESADGSGDRPFGGIHIDVQDFEGALETWISKE